MINAKVFWQGKRLIGFDIRGHADYAPHGEDIVCAAVSVLAITAVNSLLEQVGPVMIKQSRPWPYRPARSRGKYEYRQCPGSSRWRS